MKLNRSFFKTGWHDVRAISSKIQWPKVCPCCGETADASKRFKTAESQWDWQLVYWKTMDFGIEVPYCHQCMQHCKKGNWQAGVIIAAILLLLALLSAAKEPVKDPNLGVFGLILLLISVEFGLVYWAIALQKQIRQLKRHSCTSTGDAVRFQKVSKSMIAHFGFLSQKYAEQFSSLNKVPDGKK
jgi:hypothetical protein